VRAGGTVPRIAYAARGDDDCAVFGYVVITAIALFAIHFVLNQRTLFYVSVRNGRVLLVYGRCPTGLLNDMREILKHTKRASIRAVATESRARLSMFGVEDGTAQRLRNVFGLCPMSMLRAASPIARPTLGQVLGIAWLAWLFDPRR
jgi:hypothetical protein